MRRLSVCDIGKLNKDNLKTVVNAILNETPPENVPEDNDRFTAVLLRLENKFDNMKSEIVGQLKEEISTLRADHDAEFDKLRQENSLLRDSLIQHQRYLELLESQTRAENLIISGVSESAYLSHQGTEAKSDKEKCDIIFTKLGCPLPIDNTTRIGKKIPPPTLHAP